MTTTSLGTAGPRTVGICGGGIAGLALATLLEQRGFHAVVLEARSEAALATEGAFLTLAPNGMNALRCIGIRDAILAAGMRTSAIVIRNDRGKVLARMDQADDEARYGSPSVTLPRGALAQALLARARAAGAEVHCGTRVIALDERAGGVAIATAGGATRQVDIVAGCDGLHSLVRRSVCPEAPAPRFTGLVGTGGFADAPDVAATEGAMVLTFGRDAFFGYMKEHGGPVFWFSSFPSDEPRPAFTADAAAFVAALRRLHGPDPEPNAQILAAFQGMPGLYPVHDVPMLDRWYSRRMVILGDAAHAVSPHAGQGAALALEDAVVLAHCLEASSDAEAAFVRFQALRIARAEHVRKISARNGSQKRASGRFALFVRDLVLPIVIPMGAKAARRVAELRVDEAPLAGRD